MKKKKSKSKAHAVVIGHDKNGEELYGIRGLERATKNGPHLISEDDLRELGIALPEDIFPPMGHD